MQFAASIPQLLHEECLYVTVNCPSHAALADNGSSADVSQVNVTTSELPSHDWQPGQPKNIKTVVTAHQMSLLQLLKGNRRQDMKHFTDDIFTFI